MTVAENGLILEANYTAARLLNIQPKKLSKHSLPDFILKEDQDIYYIHRKHLIETGKPQSCELRMRTNDGTLIQQLHGSLTIDRSRGTRFIIALED